MEGNQYKDNERAKIDVTPNMEIRAQILSTRKYNCILFYRIYSLSEKENFARNCYIYFSTLEVKGQDLSQK